MSMQHTPPKRANDSPAPFCTVREFVARSGLSEKYIRLLVRQEQIPYLMAGNRAMIDVIGALDAIRQMASGRR